jgi:hypothetical protein
MSTEKRWLLSSKRYRNPPISSRLTQAELVATSLATVRCNRSASWSVLFTKAKRGQNEGFPQFGGLSREPHSEGATAPRFSIGFTSAANIMHTRQGG